MFYLIFQEEQTCQWITCQSKFGGWGGLRNLPIDQREPVATSAGRSEEQEELKDML